MPNRQQLIALLTENTQFGDNELVLNHEAIAIVVKHHLKDSFSTAPLFVLAGPEDLRALLPLLSLENEGQKASILIRPYIHSMTLIIRREKDGIKAFLFDSQAWGVRYYPNRLIIEALQQSFSTVQIILSSKAVQNQTDNRGCTGYALSVLESSVQHCDQLFDELGELTLQKIDDYPNTFQLPPDQLPLSLGPLTKTENNTKNMDRLTMLEAILEKYYSTNGHLDAEKVARTVKEMQGLPLFEQCAYISPMYPLTIDLEKQQIIVSFKNKDSLYGNFLIYSQQIFPGSVNLANSRFILSDATTEITVNYEANCFKLTYSANNLAVLPHRLLENSKDLYKQHMRQELALHVFSAYLTQEIELTKIFQNNGKGGFSPDQVQLILQHLLSKNREVYVPTMEELFSDAALPTVQAKSMVFGFPANDHHQIAVWVDLNEAGKAMLATLYDSYDSQKIASVYSQKLQRCLGNSCPMHFAKSCYQQQVDKWSCGVHVIANLVYLCEPINKETSDKQHKPYLDVRSKARTYYQAYQCQKKQDAQLSVIRQAAAQQNAELLHVLETAIAHHDSFSALQNFLQYEKQCPQQDQSLTEILDRYRVKHPHDTAGRSILQLLSVYDEPVEARKKISAYLDLVVLSQSQSLIYDSSLTDFFFHFSQYMGVETKDFTKEQLKSLLDILLSGKPTKEILKIVSEVANVQIAKYISHVYSKQPISLPIIEHTTFLQHVAQHIINLLGKLNTDKKIEQDRIAHEDELRKRDLNNKISEIKAILSQHLTLDCLNEDTIEALSSFTKYHFLCSFMNNKKFFPPECSMEKKAEIVVFISKLSSYENPTFCQMLQQFPTMAGRELIQWYQHMIRSPLELGKALDLLSSENQNYLLTWHKETIETLDDLSTILRGLSAENQLKFEEQYQDKIRNNHDRALILRSLSSENQLKFVEQYQDNIKNNHDRALILRSLSSENQLKFVEQYQDKIRNSDDLVTILRGLSSENQLKFVEQYQDKIRNSDDLATILRGLSSENQLKSAEQYNCKIDNLATVLRALTKDCHRLDFAMQHQNKINTALVLADVLKALSLADQLALATSHETLINTGNDLATVLRALTACHRLDFATRHRDKINTALVLADVIKALPTAADQLAVATSHETLINTGNDLATVLHALTACHRLDFATRHRDKINTALVLADVIKALPTAADQLALATSHETLINTGDNLTTVLHALTKDCHRLDFATRHQDKIRAPQALAATIKTLDSDDRLAFALRALKQNNSAIHADIPMIISSLPTKDKRSFINQYDGVGIIPLSNLPALYIFIPKDKRESVILKTLTAVFEKQKQYDTCSNLIMLENMLDVLPKEIVKSYFSQNSDPVVKAFFTSKILPYCNSVMDTIIPAKKPCFFQPDPNPSLVNKETNISPPAYKPFGNT